MIQLGHSHAKTYATGDVPKETYKIEAQVVDRLW